MDLERERGITIKAQTVRLTYQAKNGQVYELNLMDTPGHVDFAYEVSRSLAACEGSLLVVDASQGVEAQTLANVYQAIEANHEIVPVLNKIDLPAAEPERVKQQIEDVIGLDASDAIEISAKTGLNIEGVLEALVHRLPPPKGDGAAPLKALLVDSWYDQYLGVVILVRVKDGVLKPGAENPHDVDRRGALRSSRSACSRPKMIPIDDLGPGEIGFITAAIKTVADCSVGDTITDDRSPGRRAAARVQAVASRWCGAACIRWTPTTSRSCAKSLGKLRLNDASFHYEPGDLGGAGLRLPLRVPGAAAPGDHPGAADARVRPRPDRDRAVGGLSRASHQRRDDASCTIRSTCRIGQVIDHIEEPWINATIMVPDDYLGAVLQLCNERRGEQVGPDLCRQPRHGGLPAAAERGGVRLLRPAEIGARGYASFDYQMDGYAAKATWCASPSW